MNDAVHTEATVSTFEQRQSAVIDAINPILTAAAPDLLRHIMNPDQRKLLESPGEPFLRAADYARREGLSAAEVRIVDGVASDKPDEVLVADRLFEALGAVAYIDDKDTPVTVSSIPTILQDAHLPHLQFRTRLDPNTPTALLETRPGNSDANDSYLRVPTNISGVQLLLDGSIIEHRPGETPVSPVRREAIDSVEDEVLMPKFLGISFLVSL